MESELELKPCPCCGTNEQDRQTGLQLCNSYMYWPHDDGTSKCVYDDWCVVCHNCGLQTKKFDTPEEAVAAWNKRADDAN